MQLLIVAYPELTQEDPEWLLLLRERHRELHHSVLPPHFTLVFPLSGISQSTLALHISERVVNTRKIQFALRSSILVKDDFSDNYFVMLIPDEGFSSMVKLHDRLYTGVLATALRLDIPFIPHVTIGYSLDAQACKNIVDALNREGFEIKGYIYRLDLVEKESNQASTVQQFELQ